MTALFLPRTATSLMPVLIWLSVAAVSVIAATVVAVQPGQLADLHLVRQWLDIWRAGGNPYAASVEVDYPPAAFALLSPLSWFSDATILFLYVPVAVLMTAAATLMTSHWLTERLAIRMRARDHAVLIAIMLAGSSLRRALWRGQTSPLAFLLGAASLFLSRRHPRLAAVALALCAFKPHVAVGFALAIFVTEGASSVIAAGVIVGGLTWWLAGTMGETLPGVLKMYVENLVHLYAGEERVRGLLSVRWVIEDLIGAYDAATVAYLVMAVVSAALLLDAALASRDAVNRARVAVAFLLWTLLFLPHQLYHGWMAAPALWLMMWPESGVIRNERVRLVVVAAFLLFGMLDPSRSIRLIVDPDANWAIGWTAFALNPLRIVAVFALLLWTILRRKSGSSLTDLRATDGAPTR